MSQTQEEQDDADAQTKVTKRVNLVAYLDAEEGETRRQFSQRVDPERDYFEKKTTVTEDVSYFIKAHDERVTIDEDEYDKLRGVDMGDARVSKEVDEIRSEDYVYRAEKYLSLLVNELSDAVVDDMGELPGDWREKTFGSGLTEDDGDGYVSVTQSFKRMSMLKHKSEITPDDMFVDEDEDYLALQVDVTVRGVTPSQLEWLDEEYVGALMTKLGRHELVSKVRMYDCEQKTEEKGVCFNI